MLTPEFRQPVNPKPNKPLKPVRLTLFYSTQAPLNQRIRLTPAGAWDKRGYRHAYWFRRQVALPLANLFDLAALLAYSPQGPQQCLNGNLPAPRHQCRSSGQCASRPSILDPDPPPVTGCAQEYLALKAEVLAAAKAAATRRVIDADCTAPPFRRAPYGRQASVTATPWQLKKQRS